jgi:hypothetical protein
MDKKHAKKIKRDKKKKKEKRLAAEQQEQLAKQMNMFDRLPDSCSACKKIFPKTREAHMSWRVTVKNDKQEVRLFCPSCQELATKIAKEQDEI